MVVGQVLVAAIERSGVTVPSEGPFRGELLKKWSSVRTNVPSVCVSMERSATATPERQ